MPLWLKVINNSMRRDLSVSRSFAKLFAGLSPNPFRALLIHFLALHIFDGSSIHRVLGVFISSYARLKLVTTPALFRIWSRGYVPHDVTRRVKKGSRLTELRRREDVHNSMYAAAIYGNSFFCPIALYGTSTWEKKSSFLYAPSHARVRH